MDIPVTVYCKNLKEKKSDKYYFGIRKGPLFKDDEKFNVPELTLLYDAIKDLLYKSVVKNKVKYIVKGFKHFNLWKHKNSFHISFQDKNNDIKIEFIDHFCRGLKDVSKINKTLTEIPALDVYLGVWQDYGSIIEYQINKYLIKEILKNIIS